MAGLAGKVALVTGAARGEIEPPTSRNGLAADSIATAAAAATPLGNTIAALYQSDGSLHCRPAAGIGLACAQSLGRAGAKVLVCDIDAEGIKKAEQQLRDEGIDAASIVCDVSIKQQARTVDCKGRGGRRASLCSVRGAMPGIVLWLTKVCGSAGKRTPNDFHCAPPNVTGGCGRGGSSAPFRRPGCGGCQCRHREGSAFPGDERGRL